MRNWGLTLFQAREDKTVGRFVRFDEMGQGLEGDEEHLGEGEGGTDFWVLPENLLVCPDIPEGRNGDIRRESKDGW